MNKIAIPAILVATVMVAGMFAFMPVEQASTVHVQTIQGISGASATVTANTVTSTNLNNTSEFHWIVLESNEIFTIKEIEVKSTIATGLDDSGDFTNFNDVLLFPAEYYTTVAGITAAIETDFRSSDICGDCSSTMHAGDDSVDTLTHSMSGGELDDDEGNNGTITVGPKS